MSPKERMLGFDARVDPRKELQTWTSERRQIYLLRHDVDMVQSVDVLVWPSVAVSPRWTTLRDNLAQLRGSIPSATNVGQELPWVIAVTLVTNNLSEEELTVWDPVIKPTAPLHPTSGWPNLGYDVADMAMLSGLSNCGYNPSEAPGLRHDWAPHLNESHLFSNWRLAEEFKGLTNRRVPEHAPFFTYGIYTV